MAANFVKENQNLVRGGGDERWMYKFMNSNSILPPSSSGSLADTSSDAELVVLSDSVGSSACATGWTRYSGTGMCYRESTSTLTWYAAEEWCWSQRAGAHLASVHSQAEAVWLNAQYKVWYSPMDDWIGLRRACDNVTYIWTDGSAVDFLWWQPGYPKSAYAEQSCVTIWDTVLLHVITGYVPGQYDDMKECSETGSYALCKYDPNTSIIGNKFTGEVCTTTTSTTTTTTIPTTTTTATTTTSTTTTTSITTTIPATTATPTTSTQSNEVTTSTTPTTTTTTPATTTTTIPTTTMPFDTSKCPVRCPTDWVYYSNLCYGKLTSTIGGGYSAFLSECQKRGGTTAFIGNYQTNEFLRTTFSTNNVEGFDEAWLATTGYTLFAPDYDRTQGYCYAMALSQNKTGSYVARGFWRSYPCARLLKFGFCQRPV